jgi:RES domain-containing protein
MIVFRISKKAHINDLSGIGAGLYGGRWNPKGINLVYTSSSIALASLEYLVHNYHLLSSAEICLAKIKIGTPKPIMELKAKELPIHWNLPLKILQATQQFGKDFYLQQNDYILKVPSAVVPQEYNLLLNPLHKHHVRTKVVEIIDPFVFDQRLLNMKY